MSKVAIEIKGGNIISVSSSDPDLKLVIIDHDFEEHGDKDITVLSEILNPDAVSENIYELFNDPLDPIEAEIREELKRRKF